MLEVREIEQLRDNIRKARTDGKTIGLVPTMGYLHDGHLSLVKESVSECDFTVVSIYVNPAQFSPDEDLDKYPRDYDRDKELLQDVDADAIFFPDNDMMYPDGYSTWICEDKLSKYLCGKSRSTHFKGVLTVVAKLFNIIQPDKAYFGQKDYQQAVLIKKMTRELDFSIEIKVCPIVRDSDGLAMSSRNKYLSEDERADALVMSKSLFAIERAFNNGESEIEVFEGIKNKIIFENNSGNFHLEYFKIMNPDTLEPLDKVDSYALVAIAGLSGTTRLIDNVVLKR